MQFVMEPQHQQHYQPHYQPPPQAATAAAAQAPPPPQPQLAAFQLHMSAPSQPPSVAPGEAAQPTIFVPEIQNQNNSGQVTSPTPNLVSVPVTNHPPYAQMITEAITALKDKEGSSKRAIAKYIESAYSNSNLPGTHSALLTYHLKRLKDQGHLVMVKHSYMLPNPSRSPPVVPSPSPIPASDGAKRRPGRPRKTPAPPAQPPASSAAAPVAPSPPPPPPVTVPWPNVDPASVFVSLGLADGPVQAQVQAPAVPVPVPVATGTAAKRRPGRPKKTPGADGSTTPGLQPNPTLGKKSAGRPRKVAAKNAVNAAVNAAATTGFGSVVVSPRVQPRLKADRTPAKPRGRPPKKNLPATPAVAGAATVGAPAASDAVLVPAVYVGEGALATTTAAASGKRRGRPPVKAQNGVKSPRKLSGKPLGRPRKIVPPTAQGASMQQLLAYNEMRSKLGFFQTKLKQSLVALKPHLDSAGDTGAQGTLRELEELANLELGLPASVQVQQPAQPQD